PRRERGHRDQGGPRDEGQGPGPAPPQDHPGDDEGGDDSAEVHEYGGPGPDGELDEGEQPGHEYDHGPPEHRDDRGILLPQLDPLEMREVLDPEEDEDRDCVDEEDGPEQERDVDHGPDTLREFFTFPACPHP